MKTFKNYFTQLLLLAALLFMACSEDDTAVDPVNDPVDDPVIELNSITYDLGSIAVPDISGSATFTENEDNSVTVDLNLQNTPAGGEHPAHIHFNTAAEGGGIAVSLGTVDGDTGTSSVTFSTLDDGTGITYDQLLNFDGYINVHLSVDELSTIVAQGDIGQNDLTGTVKSYDLNSVAIPDISGSATFYERNNGEALAVIRLDNTPEGGEHPGHIHNNTAVEGGGIAFSFNPVDGDTGVSKTNVASLDDGASFGYDDVLDFNGYINIHLSAEDLATLVAQGDIGQNELTGQITNYELTEVDNSGISGIAKFEERNNGSTLVTIELDGTSDGDSHPAHIHENDLITTGPITVGLNPVDGATGISKTQVASLVGGESVTYNDFLTLDAYINIHLSVDQISTILAQGNIGSNVDDGGGSQSESKSWDVTNNGAASYVFNGEGLTDEANPDLTLKRGSTYTFNVNTPGHPFLIKTVQGVGTNNVYTDGVDNSGAVSGPLTFTVPASAPDTLFYNCEFHGSMTGTLTIID